ncbi:Peptidase T [Providencia rustigianii]|nr:Peptidase T [Providencia rustigianii]
MVLNCHSAAYLAQIFFTGGYNFHSKHEFITQEGMEQAVSVIMRIAELTAIHAKCNTLK